MTKFAVLIAALALVSGFQAAVVQPKAPGVIEYLAEPVDDDDDDVIREPRPQPFLPGAIEFLPEPVGPGVIEYLPEPAAEVVPELRPLPVFPELRPLPLPIVPELRPEPLPVVPELRPEPLPVVPELRPEPVPEDPCAACFSYMTALIDQLTESVAPPQEGPVGAGVLPMPFPTVPVVGPLPLPQAPVIRPLPAFIPQTRPESGAAAVQIMPY